jgi:hypothetical protein
MKLSRIFLVLVIVVLGFAVTSASATHFTIDTMVNIQNLSGDTANVDLIFYDMSGSSTTVSDTITGNNDKLYFPLGVSDGFNGSMVISADSEIRAVANLYGTVGGIGAASYTGMQSGDTDVLLPLLMKNNSGFDTWFHIQNTGTTTATVDVNYSDGTSVLGTEIGPGAAHLYDQSIESHTPKSFSAEISSDEAVAVTVIEEETAGNVMYAYNGFGRNSTDIGTGLVAPLINSNNNNYISSVQIQNAGTAQTTVTLTYTPEAGAGTSTCVETHVLDAGEMEVFTLYPFAGFDPSVAFPGASSDCDELYGTLTPPANKFVGSAQITSNSASQKLVAIAQQLSSDDGGVTFKDGEAYGSFNPAAATNTFVMPLVLEFYSTSNYISSVNLMRVGGTTAFTVTCTFSDNGYTWTSPSLAANGDSAIKIFYENLDPGHTGYVGSGVCTASETNGQIIAVVNQGGLVTGGDYLLVYEGLPVSP